MDLSKIKELNLETGKTKFYKKNKYYTRQANPIHSHIFYAYSTEGVFPRYFPDGMFLLNFTAGNPSNQFN
jgi:hypothetical protein